MLMTQKIRDLQENSTVDGTYRGLYTCKMAILLTSPSYAIVFILRKFDLRKFLEDF